jgi:hypothetical protein
MVMYVFTFEPTWLSLDKLGQWNSGLLLWTAGLTFGSKQLRFRSSCFVRDMYLFRRARFQQLPGHDAGC